MGVEQCVETTEYLQYRKPSRVGVQTYVVCWPKGYAAVAISAVERMDSGLDDLDREMMISFIREKDVSDHLDE